MRVRACMCVGLIVDERELFVGFFLLFFATFLLTKIVRYLCVYVCTKSVQGTFWKV